MKQRVRFSQWVAERNMMNKQFEKPKTRPKPASPKIRKKPKTQQRTSRKMARTKAPDEARRQLSALAEVLSAMSGSNCWTGLYELQRGFVAQNRR